MFDKFHNSVFFTVKFSEFLDKKIFDLPIDLVLLIIDENGDLADPNSEPVCRYYYAGIKRYIWKDKTWSSYPVPRKIRDNKILRDILSRYNIPTIDSVKIITIYEVKPD